MLYALLFIILRKAISDHILTKHRDRKPKHTKKTQKSSNSTTGTPPKWTSFRKLLCVDVEQFMLIGAGVLSPSHNSDDIPTLWGEDAKNNISV